MKKIIATAFALTVLASTAASAAITVRLGDDHRRPMHHRHQVCEWRHHHRVCFWR